MKSDTLSAKTEVAVWLRILHPDGELTPVVARAILKLSFPESDRREMRELSAKARAGTLTHAEDDKMSTFEQIGARLSILKSKARQALKRGNHGG